MTWKQLTVRDPREWKLSAIDPHDRDTWRSGEICHACSKPVAWKGAHCCGYGLHVNKKSDDDDDDQIQYLALFDCLESEIGVKILCGSVIGSYNSRSHGPIEFKNFVSS